jgi:hypothetical protein
MAKKQDDLKEHPPIDTIREPWGLFELEDGIRIWAKVMLLYVTKDEVAPTSFGMRALSAAAVEAPEALRGKPSQIVVPGQSAEPERVYNDFTQVRPAESLYMLPNGAVVILKLVPKEARRFAMFGPDGEPVVNIATEITFTSSPSFDGKPAKLAAARV